MPRLRSELAPATLLAAVQTVWPRVAGEEVARHSVPVSEQEGTVTVRCDSGVWSAELSMMSPRLLEGLRKELQDGTRIRDLRFVSGGS
jgi:predicted nucleic acid-binding Zn ribbon protein